MEAEPAITDPSKRSRWLHFRRWALLVAAVACGFGLWLVYRGDSESLDAESTLQADVRTLRALTSFVQTNSRWPKTWEELIAADVGQQRELQDWPGGIADLQSRVKINFQMDLKDIAKMTPESFSAVTQKSPYYRAEEVFVLRLLDAVRKTQSTEKAN